jgi:2-octaprenylphenol hydroxylase
MTSISIVGGGIAGLTAAVALATLGFSVSLSEENPPDTSQKKIEDDLRVSAISPVSVRAFQTLGVWEAIEKHHPSPFYQIWVWEENPQDPLIFDGQAIGVRPLGYIIKNSLIRQALWDKFEPYRAASEEPSLTIAADGANSLLRQKMGIECIVKDYHQKALVMKVRTSRPHEKIARQRFLPEGPLAFLPLEDEHHASIVWTNPKGPLQDAFGDVLGTLTEISPPLYFPLKMQYAKQYVKSKVALIGDAAHTIHPLAGHGVNMGIADAMTLARILKKARTQNRDIGALHTLRKYARERQAENLGMLKIVDSFTHDTLRKVGLAFSKKCAGLRNLSMQWMSHHGKENSTL